MGFRFRKSINLGGGMRINLSKSGVGYSFGTKGYRVTKTAKGRTRTTIGVPNTGLSYVTESSSNKKKSATKVNKTIKTNEKTIEDNMFSKFDLTEKEIELFSFVVENSGNLSEEFSIHDVSCMGCVVSSTYYNKLYDKGLFLKPSRGKYGLNIKLLENLAKEKEEKERLERERLENLAKEKEEKKKKNKILGHMISAWMCRIFFIPTIVIGLLVSLVEPETGLTSVAIGIIEFLYSKNYFKKKKEEEND